MSTTFAELGLNEHILAGVKALGFTTPTPVQAQAIPAILDGRDVVASAQTGTGKTAAFTLPVLQIIVPASRAAREAIVKSEPADDQPGAPKVSSFAANDGDSLSVPVPDHASDASGKDAAHSSSANGNSRKDGASDSGKAASDSDSSGVVSVRYATDDTPTPKRRRRRHHRKKATPDTSTNASEAASSPEKNVMAPVKAQAEASPASEPQANQVSHTDEPLQRPSPARKRKRKRKPAQNDVKNAEQEQPKPKRKRRRKRKKRTMAPDTRAKNPDTHPFGPFALVVTPTRELAQQIDSVVSVVCEHTGQRAVIVMGGTKFERQIRELEAGCDMLVATPGRLIDLMEHDHVDLSHVQVLVLDEADRMLDMGFWPSVRRIVSSLPPERQNLLFSATLPPSIQSTIDAMLHDPVRIEIARTGQTADTVEEHLCPVTQGQKTQLLQELIRTGGAEQGQAIERVLVFCRTKQRVDDVCRTLKQAGFGVELMHSDRPQKLRERALERFRSGTCGILVATDVMSRGIDVSGIDAVVNFDVPLDPEDYVHRVGRTGRAGATGHAYTFVAPDEISPLREIEYFTGKLVPTWDLPGFAYDEGRIVPGATRSTEKPKRTMFSGLKARGRGIAGGRYGRHY